MLVEAIPTGSLSLDAALGIGGVPKGRIIELFGPESAGKTMLALQIVAQVADRADTLELRDQQSSNHAVTLDHDDRRMIVQGSNRAPAGPDA